MVVAAYRRKIERQISMAKFGLTSLKACFNEYIKKSIKFIGTAPGDCCAI